MFKLKNQAFDAVVMDMRVKGGDSSAIVDAFIAEKALHKKSLLSAFAKNAVAPLVMMSGFFDRGAIARLGSATHNIVVKPFSIKDLAKKLEDLLGGAQKAA
jgi:CheY-like chemotaxis protein